MSEKIILGCWAVRGKAQVSRLLLAYTGAVWEDLQYTSPEQRFGKEGDLDFPFANFPYLIDGDFKLSGSHAIDRYIILRSQKKELLGKDLKDQVRIESIIEVFGDIMGRIVPLFWNPNYKEALPGVLEKLEPKLKELNDFYGEKQFAFGYLTLVDFHIAEISHYIEKISPELYSKYPILSKVRTSIESIPEVKKYYEQENSVKGPLLAPPTVIPC